MALSLAVLMAVLMVTEMAVLLVLCKVGKMVLKMGVRVAEWRVD